MSKQMHFVVTINFPDFLEPQVVRNYVKMAITKYDKQVQRENYHPGYFSGVEKYVGARITEIPSASREDLREVIAQINKIDSHFDSIE